MSIEKPILLDIPEELLTDRLLIRVPRPGDGAVIQEAIQESLPQLQEWMEWANEAQSVEVSEDFARRTAAQFRMRETMALLLFRKEDGVFIGGSGLHNLDWTVPSGEIGYWLRTSMVGQGYMTEAVRAITSFAFQHLHLERIEIQCDADNKRSAAVAERSGYKLEAHFRNHRREIQGKLSDTLVYAILRNE